MAKFGFDITEVDASQQTSGGGSYDPIPEGDYILKFEVVKGEFAGRLVWNIFNINNPSEKAQNIGRQQLVAWATACGKADADDTDKLLEKPFAATVSIDPAKGGYSASNRIKGFLLDSGDKPKVVAKSAPKAAAPASKAANPWD